jgi:hypothetical protein
VAWEAGTVRPTVNADSQFHFSQAVTDLLKRRSIWRKISSFERAAEAHVQTFSLHKAGVVPSYTIGATSSAFNTTGLPNKSDP